MFRASKKKYGKEIDHSTPWESAPEVAPKRKPSGNQSATNFKKNVPKRLREEWGERMQFFRSL